MRVLSSQSGRDRTVTKFFKKLSIMLAVFSMDMTSAAGDDVGLTPHAAEYKVNISVLGGTLRTRFEAIDGGYRAESSIEATGMSRIIANGSIRESSVMRNTSDGLLPDRFVSVNTLLRGGESADLKFDWDERISSGLINGVNFTTSLDGNVHDRVSLQYGLMNDLMQGIQRGEYLLQDAEKLKALSISNIGTKSVTVPYGRFDAVGIQHQAANSSRATTLWCVEELGYLPVIIEQHRKGKRQMRAVLTRYATL
jgi:hypothetical protein